MKYRIYIGLLGVLLISGLVWGISQSNAVKGQNKPPDVFGAVACQDDTTKKISERIATCPVPANEKSTFKSKEIAKIGAVAKVRRTDSFDGYIQITEIKERANGIEVLARAWDKNNQPIGFGKDGTVDLERFAIINPPILVDDPLGDITRTWIDRNTGETKTRKLREDLQEALLQSLAHTISVKTQKFGSENIVAGRIGNTTLTAYPNAGVGTAPIDGDIVRFNVSEVYATIRAGAGNQNNDAETTLFLANSAVSSPTDDFGRINRLGIGFGTSSIGSNNIDSATLSLYVTFKAVVLGDTDVDLVSFTPADGTNFANADFAIANFGTATRYATGVAISTLTTSVYNDWTLNADGKNYINKTGNTYFGMLIKWDTDNSFTGTWASSGQSAIIASAADETGTTQDPRLVVEHSAAVVDAPSVGEQFIYDE